MYTEAEVLEKYNRARTLNLSGWYLLSNTERVQRVCNGIGAEWMPSWMRTAISCACPHLVLAADIHDIGYDIGGSEALRSRYDAEFLSNCMVIAEATYGWYDPRRYAAKSLAKKMYSILRVAGSLAWNYNNDGEKNDEEEN